MHQIDILRTEAEDLIKAQSLMGWNSWALGDQSNQDSLYRAYAHLFTRENIDLVQSAEREEQDSTQKKRLRYFHRYLTTEFISKATASLTDKANNIEATATVVLDGKQIPYRQLAGLMANENNQKQRASLYIASDPVLDTLNTIHTQVEQANQKIAKELGYTSYNTMEEQLKEFSLEECARVSQTILDNTKEKYLNLLKEILNKQLGLDLEHFYRYDTAPLFRSRQFDRYFPESSMLKVIKQTYAGLGIDLDAQRNLHIDAEKRDAKNPRAVCYPIDIPNDIRLSIKPIGGCDDYSSLFHEMGHGQHYLNTTENAFEFKYIGEPTVTEAFAFLSEYLLCNQAWLRLNSSMPTPILKDFLRFQAMYRLYYIRRYAAKVLYEVQLHAGAADAPQVYAKFMSEAVGGKQIPSDEKRYLTDVDANYYSASYLRAWFLEAQLNAVLTKRFGPNWFEHPRAGEYLRSLWAYGDRLSGTELAKVLGYGDISPEALLAEIDTMILFSSR